MSREVSAKTAPVISCAQQPLHPLLHAPCYTEMCRVPHPLATCSGTGPVHFLYAAANCLWRNCESRPPSLSSSPVPCLRFLPRLPRFPASALLQLVPCWLRQCRKMVVARADTGAGAGGSAWSLPGHPPQGQQRPQERREEQNVQAGQYAG